MTDSKTYSASDVSLIAEIARMSEKQQTLLNNMDNLKRCQDKQSEKISSIEKRINFAAGIVAVISALVGYVAAYLMKKVGG